MTWLRANNIRWSAYLSLCFFLACQSNPNPTTHNQGPMRDTTVKEANLNRLEGLLGQADQALESAHFAEAFLALIAAEETELDERLEPNGSRLRQRASERLDDLSSRLSLEPSGPWLDEAGKLRAADTRAIGALRRPELSLTINYGMGKAAFADAPVVFEIKENRAKIASRTMTDSFGLALGEISGIEDLDRPLVLRAQLCFEYKGKAYPFSQAQVELSYLPNRRFAMALAHRSSELGSGPHPESLDPLLPFLADMGLSAKALSGEFESQAFTLAYQGSADALAKLAQSSRFDYAVLLDSQARDLKQLSYNGKLYALYTVTVECGIRIIDRNGRLIQGVQKIAKGEGGTPSKAIEAGFSAAETLALDGLRSDPGAIKKALGE